MQGVARMKISGRKLRLTEVVAMCAALSPAHLWAQSHVLVGPNILVSNDSNGPHIEPSVAANVWSRDGSTSSNELLAAAQVVIDGNRKISKLYRSTDGGSTWIDWFSPTEQIDMSSIDVQVGFDRHGKGYFVTGPTAARPPFRKASFEGSVKNESFGALQVINNLPHFAPCDHPQLAVDTTSGRYADRVYLNCDDRGLYYSMNGGRSFVGPIVMKSLIREKTNQSVADRGEHQVDDRRYDQSGSARPIVFSDGSLFVPRYEWSREDSRDITARTVEYGVFGLVSLNGGASFSQVRRIRNIINVGTGPTEEAIRSGVLVERSNIPVFAVDSSQREYKDRIYMVWSDASSGKQRVMLTSSSDRGAHWTDALEVDAKSADKSTQVCPSIAVNRDGIIGVQWFDTRGSADDKSYDLYFAASRDGGKSFLSSARVSTASSRVHQPGNMGMFQEVENARTLSIDFANGRFPSVGTDYMEGVVADRSGAFHSFWLDNRSGSNQIYTATVITSNTGVPPGDGRRPETDVSDSITWRCDPMRYDSDRMEVVIPVRLYNSSKETIYGPLRVEVTGFTESTNNGEHSAPVVEIVNAGNGRSGIGAVFDYRNTLGDRNRLAPGEITEALEWRVRYPDWTVREVAVVGKIFGHK